jgi:hypothetical protein
MTRQDTYIGLFLVTMIAVVVGVVGVGAPATSPQPAHAIAAAPDHLRAIYDPLHFKPAIETATDEQCLACHREILDDRVRTTSPAGLKATDTRAWYQQLATYTGDQETFHRRHFVTPLAKQLMNLRCNTCHEGHDPREEAPGSSATGPQQDETGFTLRKQVNPETTCLKCHGRMPAKEIMGLPGEWPDIKEAMQNDCLTCHAAFRTNRHNVDYLNAAAIEEAAKAGQPTKTGGDVCYGCHGGRAWYRIAYPYPRHAWPNMAPDTPEWAKDRPQQSEARFLKPANLNRILQPTP